MPYFALIVDNNNKFKGFLADNTEKKLKGKIKRMGEKKHGKIVKMLYPLI